MRRRYEVGCGAVLVLGLLTTGFLLFQVGALEGWGDQVELEVVLPDASGLAAGSTVAIAGVEVGRIDALALSGVEAAATLLVDPGAGIRTDARVQIRSRSVLGEKYLQIVPGDPEAPLATDGTRLAAAPPPVEIDQLVSLLGPLVQAVDPEAFGQMFDEIGQLLEEDPEVVRRMVENADRMLADAADAAEDAQRAVAEARGTVRRADRALATVEQRAREIEPVIARAGEVVDDLHEASGTVPPVVEHADQAVQELREAIGELREAGVDVSRLLETLEGIDEAAIRRVLREDGVRVRLFGPGRGAR